MDKIQKTEDQFNPLFKDLGKLNLLNILHDFFLAGMDTTANTLNWSMFFMIQNPDIQEKVREELLVNVGSKIPKMADKQITPYTEAVLHEITRRGTVLYNLRKNDKNP